jgi:hypothetical protein
VKVSRLTLCITAFEPHLRVLGSTPRFLEIKVHTMILFTLSSNVRNVPESRTSEPGLRKHAVLTLPMSEEYQRVPRCLPACTNTDFMIVMQRLSRSKHSLLLGKASHLTRPQMLTKSDQFNPVQSLVPSLHLASLLP